MLRDTELGDDRRARFAAALGAVRFCLGGAAGLPMGVSVRPGTGPSGLWGSGRGLRP